MNLGWGLTRSKLIAAESAIVNNFLWNDVWTFRDLVPEQRTLSAALKRLLKWNAICLAGLVLNVVLLNVQFNLLGMNRYLANAVAILAVTAWNFLVSRALAWRSARRRRRSGEPTSAPWAEGSPSCGSRWRPTRSRR